MVKKIAKSKKRSLTVRLDTAAKVRTVDQLMIFAEKNTAAGALLFAAGDYVTVCQEKEKLESELADLRDKYRDLKDDIREGLNAYSRIMKTIGK